MFVQKNPGDKDMYLFLTIRLLKKHMQKYIKENASRRSFHIKNINCHKNKRKLTENKLTSSNTAKIANSVGKKSKDKDIDTIPVLVENTDTCEISSMDRKGISNFVIDNRRFRRKS